MEEELEAHGIIYFFLPYVPALLSVTRVVAITSPATWEIPPGVSLGLSQENDATAKTTTMPEVIVTGIGAGGGAHMQENIQLTQICSDALQLQRKSHTHTQTHKIRLMVMHSQGKRGWIGVEVVGR